MRRRAVAWLLILACLLGPSGAAQASAPEPEAAIIVKASPGAALQTEVPLSAKELPSALRRRSLRGETAGSLPLTDTYLKVKGPEGDAVYLMDEQGALFDEAERKKFSLPGEIQSKLVRLREEARQAHYGRMADWSEAEKMIPRKSVCTVIDVETGLKFEVQRRAGNRHADMRPLTKADTVIMKRIYEGEWSWRRRAVIVERDGIRLVASMNGMPHGGDGIPDNDFKGHFCIHFPGKATHGSGNVDPDHQWMIRKAAGRLNEAFAAATPEDIIESFIVAVNQRDPEPLKYTFSRPDHPQLLAFLEEMNQIQGFGRRSRNAGKRSGRVRPPQGR
ncbi:hypothetical protein LJK88_05550 [Paenibacillus sp. P26]|nr:hypothetical protein LJK88_05550 [Paenibacillus sp. P26]